MQHVFIWAVKLVLSVVAGRQRERVCGRTRVFLIPITAMNARNVATDRRCFSVSGLASTWQNRRTFIPKLSHRGSFYNINQFCAPLAQRSVQRFSFHGCSSYQKYMTFPSRRAAVRAREGRGFARAADQTPQKHTTHLTDEDQPDQTLMLALARSTRSVSGLLSFEWHGFMHQKLQWLISAISIASAAGGVVRCLQ